MPQGGENYYDDGPGPAVSADQAPQAEEGGDEGGKTSILPKSFFHGSVNPGDVVQVRVVACHENDCEVQPADQEGDAGEQEQPQAAEPAAAPEGSMASMMG